MELYKIIEQIVRDSGRPMMIKDIVSAINISEKKSIHSDQVLEKVKKYPLLFENINGLVILTNDSSWKNILINYLYLKESLKGVFSDSQIQHTIAVLFFYRRLLDINDRQGRRYPIYFIGDKNTLESKILGNNEKWIENLKLIENYYIAPRGVFYEVANLLLKMPSHKKLEIELILSHFNTTFFNDLEFGHIYEYLIYHSSKEYLGYESATPETIRYLLPKLLQIKDGSSVYDPVAGIGGVLSKALSLNNNIRPYGTEINTHVAQLGNMNLMMYGFDETNIIDAQNCFNEINNERKFDYIVGDLSANGIANSYEQNTLYNIFKLKSHNFDKGFNSFVLFCYYKLSLTGKAAITVSESFLFREGIEKEVRNILLKNDVIEAVISLPKGTYRPFSAVKASIIIINKDKPKHLHKKIKFIRANSIEEGKHSLLLNTDEIIEEYQSVVENSKLSQIISLNEIRDDLNLSVDNLLGRELLFEGVGKRLKDIVDIKSGVQPIKSDYTNNGDLPIIKIENLSKGILDINLDVDSITSTISYNNKYDKAIINQQCILIAKIGDKLKPTIFQPNPNKKVLLHVNVFALIPKNESIDIEYLYYQLYSDFVAEQVNLKKKGALILFFNKKELQEIIIPYESSLEIQRKIVITEKARQIAAENKRLEETKKLLGYKEETKESEINIVRTITHQLKHSLLGIYALIKKTMEIIHKNNIENFQQYEENDPILIKKEGFESPENLSLYQTVEKALKQSELLNKILTDVEKAIHLQLELSDENVYTLLNEVKKGFQGISIKIKGNRNIISPLSKSHIEDLFNTLIQNAIQHSNLPVNKLKIFFSIEKDLNTVKIEYTNNGSPLGISGKDFISILAKSQYSKGKGIGGYYINKIIEAHSGSLMIEDLSLGVHMTIILPLKNDKYE